MTGRVGVMLVLAVWLALLPGVAQANVGVPMLIIVMPVMVLSLIPIIAVEARVYARAFAAPGRRAVKAATLSNLFSTFIGIPISWVLLLVFQGVVDSGRPHGLDTLGGKILSVTLQAPLLMPYNEGAAWMVPVAGLVLMVPFFFASWWSEYWIVRRMFRDTTRDAVWTAVRNANLLTYGLLTLWPLGVLVAGALRA